MFYLHTCLQTVRDTFYLSITCARAEIVNYIISLIRCLFLDSSNLYTVSAGPDKVATQQVVGVKHILPMLPSTISPGTQVTNTSHHINAPVAVQTMHSTVNAQNQGQQQV